MNSIIPKKIIGLFFLLMALFRPSHAQDIIDINDLRMRHFQLKDGLSTHMAERIIEDKQGFIWLGTYNGLLKFDGYDFIKILDGKIGAILEDNQGFIWAGTQENLWRYDPRTNQKKSFYYREQTVPDRWYDIVALAQDSTGAICVGTAYNCLVRLIPKGRDNYETFQYPCSNDWPSNDINSPGDTLQGNWLWNVVTAENGSTWIGTSRGMSEMIIPDGLQPDSVHFKYAQPSFEPYSGNRPLFINHINQGRNGQLWVVAHQTNTDAPDNNGVIFQFDPASRDFIEYTHDQNPFISFRYIHEDRDGNLWNGPFSEGLQFIAAQDIHQVNDHQRHLQQFKSYPFTLPGDVPIATDNVQGIMEDRFGTIWVLSNFMGVYQIPNKLNVFRHIKLPKTTTEIQNEVSGLVSKGDDIWVSTWSNGLFHYNTHQEVPVHYAENGSYPLPNIVPGIFTDSKDRLWALTANQSIHLYNPANQQFKPIRLGGKASASHPFDFLTKVCEDHDGKFWIGTGGEGLFYFDPETEEVLHHFRVGDPGSDGLRSNIISEAICDDDGTIWVGSPYQGVMSINQKADGEYRFDRYLPDIPLIGEMYIDRQDRFWITTYAHGLIQFDRREKKVIRSYTTENGLPNNNIYGIAEDDKGLLWLTTPTGLANLDTENGSIRFYGKGYGFKFSQKMPNDILISENNELIFGGDGGYYRFDLDREQLVPELPPLVVLKDLAVNNVVQQAGHPESILDTSIQYLNSLTLKHDQNNLEIAFTGIYYDDPESVEYAFKLENYHDSWQKIETPRIARMTNLIPGHYVFKARATQGTYQSERQLKIHILAPLWATWWAKALYFGVGMGLLWAYMFFKNKLRTKHMEMEKISTLNQMRSRFFANISHEFRTPLTLIKGPLEDRINHITDQAEKEELTGMYRQTNRMLKLVDELLDLSKIDRDKLELRKRTGDIFSFLQERVESFRLMAKDRGLKLDIKIPDKPVILLFDPDNLEKIVVNLLANAIKFAGENGRVSLDASYDGNQGNLQFSVYNDGKAIPSNEITQIFDQFYQAENAQLQGSGVGLALVKELVDLMKGKISVSSAEKTGTVFTVKIPLSSALVISSEVGDEGGLNHDLYREEKMNVTLPPQKSKSDRHILVVEDNGELRTYIRKLLEKDYTVIEAENGKAGWELTKKLIPDIIISDIMMPEMDGVELCRRVKSDLVTDHIPVILLTARVDLESRIEGLESQADDYINKPFHSQELMARVSNLVMQREKLKSRFKRHIALDKTVQNMGSADQNFLRKALKVVNDHMEDANFSVESFSAEMNLSRTHFHKKLKSITGQSPSEFLRNLRLQRASELLISETDNISQIAYQVGFNNLSYFTKCFKEKYNVPPSDYLSKVISN